MLNITKIASDLLNDLENEVARHKLMKEGVVLLYERILEASKATSPVNTDESRKSPVPEAEGGEAKPETISAD